MRKRTIFEAFSSFINTGVDTAETMMGGVNKGAIAFDNVMDTGAEVTGRHNRVTKIKSTYIEREQMMELAQQEKELLERFPDLIELHEDKDE